MERKTTSGLQGLKRFLTRDGIYFSASWEMAPLLLPPFLCVRLSLSKLSPLTDVVEY
jgi:hypothetical protein